MRKMAVLRKLGDEHKNGILGILLIVLGLSMILSLVPNSWLDLPETDNLAGKVGRLFSDPALSLFGIATYCLPIIILIWGWNRLVSHSLGNYIRPVILIVFSGLIAIAFIALLAVNDIVAGSENAGKLGEYLAQEIFTKYVGVIGSYIILTILLLALLIVTVRINPVNMLKRFSLYLINMIKLPVAHLARLYSSVWSFVFVRLRQEKRTGKEVISTAEEKIESEELDSKLVKKSSGRTHRKGKRKSQKAQPEKVRRQGTKFELPSLELLETSPPRDIAGKSKDLDKLGRVLIEKMSHFNVQGRIVNILSGPVVAVFEVEPAPGIKVNKIANLADDLALALRALRIRIVAPIPGKGAVGIEVPNKQPEKVYAKDILSAEEFTKSSFGMPLAFGVDIVGKPVVTDLTRMPHLLIAGATGSGKSVSLNVLITSLLYRFSPKEVKLLLIDPKMLELVLYNGLPHLIHPVVTDSSEAAKALRWALMEMKRRYELLAHNGVRGIGEFNKRIKAKRWMKKPVTEEIIREKLSYVVIVVDELADLMLTVGKEVEEALARLAQMARAVGIHLIVATQRPSVDVITGLIKANFPTRLSFQVTSKTDSRTILDMNGAEKLLGNGDMLFLPAGAATPTRVHGAYISVDETKNIVKFLRKVSKPDWEISLDNVKSIIEEVEEKELKDVEETDALFNEAAKLVILHRHGSTSLLQRRLKIGYSRAARIIDQLEESGIVGSADGSKAREVLVDNSYLESIGV